MIEKLEVEVAHIHIAGGAPRVTPPPGALAEVAPRRAARGRSEDVLFISLSLNMPEPASPGITDHLARLASDAYFSTPGSVTAALREAVVDVNTQLQDLARDQTKPRIVQGSMMAAVMRGKNIFIAQCGVGHFILIRPDQVSTFTSEEATSRPLGLTLSPFVRYHHFEASPQDLLILATLPHPLWAETTLSGLSGLDAARAVDRLSAASTEDRNAMLVRFSSPGELTEILTKQPSESRVSIPVSPTTLRGSQPLKTQSVATGPSSGPSPMARGLKAVSSAAQSGWTKLVQSLTTLAARMAPGLREPPRPGAFSPALLTATAIAIPLIVVAITSFVYLRQGRPALAEEYVFKALSAVASAQIQPDAESARPYWEEALDWLDRAEKYGVTQETTALRLTAQGALDSLDHVTRLSFVPAVREGFRGGSEISHIAAANSGLYVMDQSHLSIWYAWSTGRGYEIDQEFQCLEGPDSIAGMGAPVDMAIHEEPGPMGTEQLVAIDTDGTLLFCSPSQEPSTVTLTPPDTGLGRVMAIDVLDDSLYVLAPDVSMVWIFRSFNSPGNDTWEYFFADSLRDLTNAIDIMVTYNGLLILYDDGHVDICNRSQIDLGTGGVSIHVECETDLSFEDPRLVQASSDSLLGFVPDQIAYSPRLEPSLYLLDSQASSVLRYGMNMNFLDHYRPLEPLPLPPTAITLAPPFDIFLAAGNQVYYAEITP
ncbi:MAG: hypothetical protein PVI78_00360 [Anaerolineales bacterium]